MNKYNTINVEDFTNWADKNETEYTDFYDDELVPSLVEGTELDSMTAEEFYNFCLINVEDAQDMFEEYILPLIEELEQDDYFGTEGFDKRFS